MPETIACQPCCSTPQTVNIPGPEGPNGTAGADGTNGINSYTTTTFSFIVPALNSTVNVPVVTSLWAVVGQPVVVYNGTSTTDSYVVTAVPDSTHITLKYLNVPTNTNAGGTINSGSGVAPGGFVPFATPLAIVSGGTGAATKAAAQTALGVGQDALISTVTGLTQSITGSYVQVGSCGFSLSAAGRWLYEARAVVDWSGVTFASSRTVNLKVRNTTQNYDITSASFTYATQTPTTTGYPSTTLTTPFALDSLGAVNDAIQILIIVSVANSAGTFQVTGGSLIGLPIRLT